MAIYDQVYVEVNGALLMENMEVDTEIAEDISQVKTIARGFAGITPGSAVRTIKLKNVVPVSGFEFNWERAMLKHEEVELRLTLGGSGLSTISKGYIIGPVGISSAIGKTTDNSVDFVGTATEFA